jgi:hypothetical protein
MARCKPRAQEVGPACDRRNHPCGIHRGVLKDDYSLMKSVSHITVMKFLS